MYWCRSGAAAVKDGLESDGGRSWSRSAVGVRPPGAFGREAYAPAEPTLHSPVDPNDAEAALALNCLHAPAKEVSCWIPVPWKLSMMAALGVFLRWTCLACFRPVLGRPQSKGVCRLLCSIMPVYHVQSGIVHACPSGSLATCCWVRNLCFCQITCTEVGMLPCSAPKNACT